jgi:hypothetical protein
MAIRLIPERAINVADVPLQANASALTRRSSALPGLRPHRWARP